MPETKLTLSNIVKESYGPQLKKSEAVKRMLKRRKKYENTAKGAQSGY